ncbi:helix-turn-helix domain-containing protein [Clostridium sp.]|uniref:helix-turn-helix domain-containing protein n=1 Tax=Clostridium sp. TaxID=1506 RepID=UPI002FC865FE
MKPYERLKQLRISKGITTYELSELTGIPQSTISKMENGKRKIETDSLELLSKALNINVNEFFNDSHNNEFDEETRAIARGMQKLSPDKKDILKALIKTMSEAADEEFYKK